MYLELLTAIENKLKQEIPELDIVKASGALSSQDELKNLMNQAPALRLALNDTNDQRTNFAQFESMCDLKAYLVTSNNNQEEKDGKDIQAYKLLEKIKQLLINGRWGLADVDLQKKVYDIEMASVKASPLSSPFLYQNGLTVWEISWQQKVIIGKDLFDDINQGELGELEVIDPESKL